MLRLLEMLAGLALLVLPAFAAAAPPVSVKPFSSIALYPERSAQAQVLSRNEIGRAHV